MPGATDGFHQEAGRKDLTRGPYLMGYPLLTEKGPALVPSPRVVILRIFPLHSSHQPAMRRSESHLFSLRAVPLANYTSVG